MRGTVKKFYEFAVMGKGIFPLDMLRYDQCFPMSGADVEKMEDGDYREIRTVRLCACSHVNYQPTEGRWSSFGWPVVMGSFKEV